MVRERCSSAQCCSTRSGWLSTKDRIERKKVKIDEKTGLAERFEREPDPGLTHERRAPCDLARKFANLRCVRRNALGGAA
jgi:hypothetical protein